jgi:N-methylhydantoinase A
MIGAIEQITIRRGVDPREYMLIVGGGAGAVHAARLAQELQMKRVLIPRVAGVLCALGMLASDITFENVGSLGTTSNEFDVTGVNQLLADLTARGTAALIAEGVPEEDRIFEYFVDARYPGQTNETSVTMRSDHLTPEAVAQLAADFHETHQKTYGSSEPGAIVEFGHWRVVARGRVEKLKLPEHKSARAAKDPAPALKGKRQAYFDGQYLDTPVYDGDKIEAGNVIPGPAIIEEATTTVIVTPQAKITVTQRGDYFMELA